MRLNTPRGCLLSNKSWFDTTEDFVRRVGRALFLANYMIGIVWFHKESFLNASLVGPHGSPEILNLHFNLGKRYDTTCYRKHILGCDGLEFLALCPWMRVCPCKKPCPLSYNCTHSLYPVSLQGENVSQAGCRLHHVNYCSTGLAPWRKDTFSKRHLCFVSYRTQNWLSLKCSSGRPVMFAFLTLTLALLSYRCSRMTLVIEKRGLGGKKIEREKERTGKTTEGRRLPAWYVYRNMIKKKTCTMHLSFPVSWIYIQQNHSTLLNKKWKVSQINRHMHTFSFSLCSWPSLRT